MRRIARFVGCGYKPIFFNHLDNFAKGYQQAYQQKMGITLRVSGMAWRGRSGRRSGSRDGAHRMAPRASLCADAPQGIASRARGLGGRCLRAKSGRQAQKKLWRPACFIKMRVCHS